MGTPLGPKYIPYTYMDPLGGRSQVPLFEFKREKFVSGLVGLDSLVSGQDYGGRHVS